EDKQAAYQTLYECLVTLVKLLAPIMPFVSEEIYQNLVRAIDINAPESVHLNEFPMADPSLRNEQLENEMALVRTLISQGLAARKLANIKVRQPLADGIIVGADPATQEQLREHLPIICEELNIKEIKFANKDFQLTPNYMKSSEQNVQYEFYINTMITQELEYEGLARELVHKIQNLRKSAGFDVVDRIELFYETSPKLQSAISRHYEYIANEVLATKIAPFDQGNKELEVNKTINVNEELATIGLKRTKKYD
ncbi:MAG: DUF5915 domain-containing protein, partial [candidate division WOR-3 bacterium]